MNEHSFEEDLQKFVDELKDEEQMTEKQRNILQASIKLFATKGFHASSTAEIAKEAGVAEGTIFRHYKSKKDILIAVVAPVLVKFAASFILKDVKKILSEQETKSFGQLITEIIRNRLELIGANQKHARILLQEAFFHEELRDALMNSVIRDARKMTGKLVEDRIAKGELRPLPPDAVVRMFVTSMMGLVFFKYVVDPEEYSQRSEEEQIELTVDILLNGVLNR
jgi:AcrR family transcriptional regulator